MLIKGFIQKTQSWVHVCGYFWVHVCAFWVHVYGAVGCMYAVVGCKVCGCLVQSMRFLGGKYTVVGCIYVETLGCMYAVVVCKSMERLGACLTVGSLGRTF